jgi:hypothetical protein
MSISDFKKKVQAAAKARNGEPLYNSSLEHAAILTEAMFQYANDEVCILSGELNARVYGRGEVVEQAKLFLADPDHSLRVLVESSSEADREDHPFYEEFLDHDNAKFRQVPPKLREKYIFHLMVMDGDSYRFEEDKGLPSAVAAFGDTSGGENLGRIFETLWDNSENLDS